MGIQCWLCFLSSLSFWTQTHELIVHYRKLILSAISDDFIDDFRNEAVVSSNSYMASLHDCHCDIKGVLKQAD